MMKWMMAYVTSVSFVVLVNVNPSEFFEAERGLRQGCPLSPLLFLLVIEGFNRLLLKEKAGGRVKGIKININLFITHLMFVDDIMILGSGSIDEWGVISGLIENFCVSRGSF